MADYLEKIKKANFFRNELINNFIKNNSEYPNKEYIESLVEDIDTRLSIFDYDNVDADEPFDTDKFNQDLFYIYSDLKIIYELIYEISVNKYYELEKYCDCYLMSLENMADSYEKKADTLLNSTSLGNTVLYQDSGFDIEINNQNAVISLADFTLSDLSIVSFIIDGNGFNNSNVLLKFGDYTLSPHSVNYDTIKLNGEAMSTTYTYELDEEENVGSSFKIDDVSLIANSSYDYRVYSSYGNILKTEGVTKSLYEYEYLNDISSDLQTTYTFYLINATYIKFDFSIEPIYKNFNDYYVDITEDVAFFSIEMPADSEFNFTSDGIIYAKKETSSVIDESLYVMNLTDGKDFYVIEEKPLGVQTFEDVKVYISGIDINAFEVNSLAIKAKESV
jgi:hypothetical protein